MGEQLMDGYRALDLTEGGCLICGKILGDLGADVIKIERPGGDRTRNRGPFYKDIPHPEKSLFWFFTNLNKRGITLDIETFAGREIFKRLVKTADFVLESFQPGYLDELGLGYKALEEINPGIIMTAITPFGQTGPYAHYKMTDIVGQAMWGMMRINSYFDSPPYRMSTPQVEFQGGLHGALGSMVALYHRELTSEGQHVDVSCQVATATGFIVDVWEFIKISLRGFGPYTMSIRPTGLLLQRLIWPCKDGYIYLQLGGGAQAGLLKSSRALMEMAWQDGICLELKDYDWASYDTATITQEERNRLEKIVGEYLLTKTKSELFEEAVKREILLVLISDPKDLAQSPQLQARGFWEKVEHPELGDTVTYPGFPVKISGFPYRVERRAPLIGEHNQEIYEKELGLSREQLVILKSQGVI